MVDVAALVSAITAFVVAGAYGYLAARLSGRRVSAGARLAAGQFSLFWAVFALGTAVDGAESLDAAFTTPPLAVAVTAEYVVVLLLCVLLWSLVCYLFYLFTGREIAIPLAGLYAVLYVLLLYYFVASMPSGVSVHQGAVGLTYASTVTGPILGVLLLILVVPEIVGTICYLTLLFRTRDPTVRYRVALVGFSLLAFFGLSFIGLGSLLGGSLAAVTFAQLIGVIAVAVILLAYYPPESIRRRYGVHGIDDGPLPAPVPN